MFAGDYKLIELLLEHGADPGLKQGWAVVTAIMSGTSSSSSERKLELVKALIERGTRLPYPQTQIQEGGDSTRDGKKKKRKRGRDQVDNSVGNKKARMEDRCKPTPEMLEIAVKTKQWEIVDYLTKKGKENLLSHSLGAKC